MILLRTFLVVWAVGLAAAGTEALAQQLAPAPEAPTGRTAKSLGTAQKYMVAAANPLAAEAGREMLRAGGSAVDAAIAVQLVLNLVEPQSSGIGGGAFLVHWSDAGRGSLSTLDGRETAPATAKPDLFIGRDGKPMPFMEAVVGGRSVGVPGTMKLLDTAHKSWGKLPWPRLFEPAIRLADEGFAISPRLNGLLGQEKYLQEDPIARAYFYQADRTPKPVGTVLKNPAYARTLRDIAAKGADAFYTGEIAADIVATATRHTGNPGDMTLEDLRAYKVEERGTGCGV
jgi:gamma-glutamyltranspeptidase / glutathione hydrolase